MLFHYAQNILRYYLSPIFFSLNNHAKNNLFMLPYVGLDLGTKHGNEPLGGALCEGVDSPRQSAGRSTTWAQVQILLCMLLDGPR
jgi:hypothetical protein